MPALLQQLYDSPSNEVWADLFAACVHSGSASQAAYAVAPHVVAAAEQADAEDRVDYIVFLAAIASSHGEESVPDELRAEYEAAVDSAGQMAMELTANHKVSQSDLPFLFEAVAAMQGLRVLARILGQLANFEFGFVCGHCHSDLWVTAASVPFQVYSTDPIKNQAAIYRSVRPVKEPIAASNGVPSEGRSALPWLLWLADLQNAELFRSKLLNLYGDGICPKCGEAFNLYEQLESAMMS